MRWTLTLSIAWASMAGSAFAQYEGTRSVPNQYATIQSAIDASNIDDRIVVSPGTYVGPILVSKRLHLVGTAPGVILSGSGSTSYGHKAVIKFQAGGTLRGVTVEKAAGSLADGWDGEGGVIAAVGSGTLQDPPFRMRDCVVRDCGVGVVLDGDSVVQNCLIRDCGVGVWTPLHDDSTFAPNTTRILNSVFAYNGEAIRQSLQDNTNLMTNNVFYFNSTAALHTSPWNAGTGSYELSYNDFWGNGAVFYGTPYSPPGGNLAVDPKFVDAATGDFHLQSTSTLLNAGSPGLLDDDLTRSDLGRYGGPTARLRPLSVLPSKGTVTTTFKFTVIHYDVVPPAAFVSPPGYDGSAVAGNAVAALHLWGNGTSLFKKPTSSDSTPGDGAKSTYFFGPTGYQEKFKFRYEARTPFGEWLYGPSATSYRTFTAGPDLSAVAREEVHSPPHDSVWAVGVTVIGFGMELTPHDPYNGFKGRLYYRRNGGLWKYRTANLTHTTSGHDYFHTWLMVGLHVFSGDLVEYYYWGRDGNGPDFMDRNDADGVVKYYKLTIQ